MPSPRNTVTLSCSGLKPRCCVRNSNDPVYLYVSSADPAFADAVIDAYEKGMRRIAASGELDRIFEYYDMTHDPIPDMPCDRAM